MNDRIGRPVKRYPSLANKDENSKSRCQLTVFQLAVFQLATKWFEKRISSSEQYRHDIAHKTPVQVTLSRTTVVDEDRHAHFAAVVSGQS